ncbi:GNAT family N-acetyltransferase [Sinorhizobium medicae]|uniref:GNAT family N-acetyltransferase n=1 Tax=Sinorhizobium medicae TaxID=110321 RepID=UPI00119C265E|nr:GNAT family N-acetyltransferase [Sinorhizobium medicae]MDX1065994.1 GNAT family N-acetyltransferase [Sinorhizobium medicae]MDX1206778.1 GNAT family N-acetyltransferase [Sinorhizobium medicae]MQU75278.1 GNAT family N-acetyltransferase [Sinorhizobium medicae]TWA32870.1 acetyltransferase (GNAT) family protein [Sinorhizobium medicae]
MDTPSQKSDQRTAEGPYRIRFYENCGYSPAQRLVALAMVEIEERGFHGRRLGWPMPETPCMAAIDKEGNAIGLLTYFGESDWQIVLAYVSPEHRRKGIHTALHTALVDKAKKQGNVFSINSNTHVNNLAAQAAFKAQGRVKEFINYSFPLKDWGDGKEPTE